MIGFGTRVAGMNNPELVRVTWSHRLPVHELNKWLTVLPQSDNLAAAHADSRPFGPWE